MEKEELFEITPGENPWEIIPEEIICEVILRIRDFRDIIRYMNSSQRFRRIAQTCIILIDSPELIEVEIELLTNFQVLQLIGDNIHLIIRPETIPLLDTLPNLRKADIFLEGGSFAEEVFELLPKLNLQGKVPLVNFRITDRRSCLYIQGKRYMVLPLIVDHLQKDYPYLENVYIPTVYGHLSPGVQYRTFNTPGQPFLRLMSRTLRTFISEGDFGLMDPSQPHSQPLSIYLKRLANSGLIELMDLGNIFGIYFRYHNLRKFAQGKIYISPDALMTKHLHKFLDQTNEARAVQGIPPIHWNLMALGEFLKVEERTTYRYTRILRDLPSPSVLFDFDIPIPLDPQEYDQIFQILERTVQIYDTTPIRESV